MFIVYLPIQAAGGSADLTQGFLSAIALDVVVIPWRYVFVHWIKKPGERWRQSRGERRLSALGDQ
jgi:hypothetical protein